MPLCLLYLVFPFLLLLLHCSLSNRLLGFSLHVIIANIIFYQRSFPQNSFTIQRSAHLQCMAKFFRSKIRSQLGLGRVPETLATLICRYRFCWRHLPLAPMATDGSKSNVENRTRAAMTTTQPGHGSGLEPSHPEKKLEANVLRADNDQRF